MCFKYFPPVGVREKHDVFPPTAPAHSHHFPPLRRAGLSGVVVTRLPREDIFLIWDCGVITQEPDKEGSLSALPPWDTGWEQQQRESGVDPPYYSPYPWNNELSLTSYFNLFATV